MGPGLRRDDDERRPTKFASISIPSQDTRVIKTLHRKGCEGHAKGAEVWSLCALCDILASFAVERFILRPAPERGAGAPVDRHEDRVAQLAAADRFGDMAVARGVFDQNHLAG